MKIVWIEDDTDTISAMLEALAENEKVRIFHFKSAYEARANFDRGMTYDLIFLDSQMLEPIRRPETGASIQRDAVHSGPDLYNDLRAGEWGAWGKTAKIVFSTAYIGAVRSRVDLEDVNLIVESKDTAFDQLLHQIHERFSYDILLPDDWA